MVGTVNTILSANQKRIVLAQQDTAVNIGIAQAELASGREVNSALDDPLRFFASQALNNRALDLQKTLDGVGQSIQTVKTAILGIDFLEKQLDLAESFLTDTRTRIQTGEIPVTTPGPVGPPPPFTPSNETPVLFPNTGVLQSYAGGQDAGGPLTVSPDGTTVEITGNQWKRRSINYTVTADTVLIFDYQTTNLPEISAIGFDNDNNFSNSNNQFFLAGSQTGGIAYSAPISAYRQTVSGTSTQIEIPIGAFFTGTFSHLTLINDDDAAPNDGNTIFSNIILREGPVETPPPAPVGTTIDPTVQQDLEDEYTQILDSYDDITFDAEYRNVRLLQDDDLTTIFNEDDTSSIFTEGVNATTADLGLIRTGFTDLAAVQAKIDAVQVAREQLRIYARELGQDLNIIQVRERFTKNMINKLISGSDKLTLADQNEVGARLLALQTRQQLQITSLSLASQAPILSLF